MHEKQKLGVEMIVCSENCDSDRHKIDMTKYAKSRQATRDCPHHEHNVDARLHKVNLRVWLI